MMCKVDSELRNILGGAWREQNGLRTSSMPEFNPDTTRSPSTARVTPEQCQM